MNSAMKTELENNLDNAIELYESGKISTEQLADYMIEVSDAE